SDQLQLTAGMMFRLCGVCKTPYDAPPGPDPGCPKCGGHQAKITRMEYIRQVMEKQGISKNPRKYVVLRDWNTIVDSDRDYELEFPALPPIVVIGRWLWTMKRTDDPELIRVKVIEDHGAAGLFVETQSGRSQFLITREDARQSPIPLRPKAVRRKDLVKWIGEGPAQDLFKIRAQRHAEQHR